MRKIFFLVAFAAIALTMGLTSCEKENKNDYELKVYLYAAKGSNDHDETKDILSEYYNSFGYSAVAEDKLISVNGKDSLDCIKVINENCAKAEAKLKGNSWTDQTSIWVISEDEDTQIYECKYGIDAESADNASVYDNRFGKCRSYDSIVPDVDDYTFAKSFSVQENGHTLYSDTEWQRRIYFNTENLNSEAGGRFLYLCTKISDLKISDIKTMISNNDESLNNGNLIGDVIVLNSYTHPDTITYDGIEYKAVKGGTDGEREPVDLNYKAGGPYLYMYYSTDVLHFRRVLDLHGSWMVSSGKDFSIDKVTRYPVYDRYDSSFAKGVEFDENGNIRLSRENGVDLNEGAGGDYIHFLTAYLPFDYILNNL